MSSMPQEAEEYRRLVAESYHGERVAAAVYGTLSGRATAEPARSAFRAIAAVEDCTGDLLQPIAARLGIPAVPVDYERAQYEYLELRGAQTWTQFLDDVAQDWPRYIGEFRAILEMAPPQDRAVMDLVVGHECALVDFIALERQGEHAGALARLDAFLAEALAFARRQG
jgi:hypothetical protein